MAAKYFQNFGLFARNKVTVRNTPYFVSFGGLQDIKAVALSEKLVGTKLQGSESSKAPKTTQVQLCTCKRRQLLTRLLYYSNIPICPSLLKICKTFVLSLKRNISRLSLGG